MSVKTRFTKKRTNPSRKLKIPSNQGITIQRNDSGCDESQKRTAVAKAVNTITNEENSPKCRMPRVRLQRVGTNFSAAQYKIAKLTLSANKTKARGSERKEDRSRAPEHPRLTGEPR